MGVLTTFLLARMLGPVGYGAYAIVLSSIGLRVVVAGMGFRTLLVREIARYHSPSEPEADR